MLKDIKEFKEHKDIREFKVHREFKVLLVM